MTHFDTLKKATLQSLALCKVAFFVNVFDMAHIAENQYGQGDLLIFCRMRARRCTNFHKLGD